MNTEHKIILSMYYANSGNKMDNNRDANNCVGMDLEQLLLMLAGVFNLTEYVHEKTGAEISVVPSQDKKDGYANLVDDSNPEMARARILKVQDAEKPLFGKCDYKLIDEVNINKNEARKNLFYLNLLIEHINQKHHLYGRRSFIYYSLFSSKGGKSFVGLLLYMLQELVKELVKNSREGVKSVLRCLNHEYRQMEEIYEKKQNVVDDMAHRGIISEDIYEIPDIVNEIDMFQDRLQEQSEAFDKTWFGFVFFDNMVSKERALHLIQHIIMISNVIIDNQDIEPSKNICQDYFYQNSRPKEFEKADAMVNELVGKYHSKDFNIVSWAEQYNEYIAAIKKEWNL